MTWMYISTHATVATCLKLTGARILPCFETNSETLFPDAAAWRRPLAVCGRTGAALLVEPIPPEKLEDMVACMTGHG